MRNFELKCRCDDLDSVLARALALGAQEAGVLEQDDLFFRTPTGRLKLRRFPDGRGELISYVRPDHPGERVSDYRLYRTGAPDSLAAALEHSLGSEGRVRKRRRLLLHRRTRIHLDEVEGLGSFVELETVVTTQSDAEAEAELCALAEALGLRSTDRIAVAYHDLLQGAGSTPECPAPPSRERP